MSYFLTLFLLLTSIARASDLGTYGTTFSIDEDDLLIVLKQRLTEVKNDEDTKQELIKGFVASINAPKGKKIPKAISLHIHIFDPTIVVQEDIRDNDGKIIVLKGSSINPLEKTRLNEDLIFFDGTDFEQVSWARQQQGKWIITDGKPLELEEFEERAVYFDQGGYLVLRLGIKTLPARVFQDGNVIKIEETPCF